MDDGRQLSTSQPIRSGIGGSSGIRTKRKNTSDEYSHLRELAGDAEVEAMASVDDVFAGDMRHFTPVTLTLSALLDHSVPCARSPLRHPAAAANIENYRYVYLAQTPLWTAATATATTSNSLATDSSAYPDQSASAAAPGHPHPHSVDAPPEPQCPLAPLMADISVPALLQPLTANFAELRPSSRAAAAATTPAHSSPSTHIRGNSTSGAMHSINFWLSVKGSRSSLHFDDYNNVLCVVSGRKRVSAWPPSCTNKLYPHPLGGECANHSRVDVSSPHVLETHPLFADAEPFKSVYDMRPGDALYIPEGWWHQVDSDPHTAAVNFWWESDFARGLGGVMDAYYARKSMESLVASEKTRVLGAFQHDAEQRWSTYLKWKHARDIWDGVCDNDAGDNKRQRLSGEDSRNSDEDLHGDTPTIAKDFEGSPNDLKGSPKDLETSRRYLRAHADCLLQDYVEEGGISFRHGGVSSRKLSRAWMHLEAFLFSRTPADLQVALTHMVGR